MEGAQKPTTAFVLSLIGGIIILINGIYYVNLGIYLKTIVTASDWFDFSGLMLLLGVINVVSGIVVIVGAILLYKGKQSIGGILVIIFSFTTVFSGGAWGAGLILGVIGGVLVLIKKHNHHNET